MTDDSERIATAERLMPTISLKDYENRKEEITKQLVDAAENSGFFALVDHGITLEEINAQFDISKKFFGLPPEVKNKTPYDINHNLGWEYKAQTRRLTGVDQKESLWLKRRSQWPSDDDVPGFRSTTENFLAKCATISTRVLDCFAVALGFPQDYFHEPMDVWAEDTITQLRFLHYMESENAGGTWRAGAHTDVGCLTLLFQEDGGDGLEICPGRENYRSRAVGDNFFPLPARTGPIVVNLGDMLMSWSDDRFKATFHRVHAKEVGYSPSRYSIAYFNQGRENFVFQGPKKKYPAQTCGEYFHNYTNLQFGGYPDKSMDSTKHNSMIAAKN